MKTNKQSKKEIKTPTLGILNSPIYEYGKRKGREELQEELKRLLNIKECNCDNED